jgi:hypothetical protein
MTSALLTLALLLASPGACEEELQPPAGTQAPAPTGEARLKALSEIMRRDLSERARLGAALEIISMPGGDALTLAESFLKSEPGAQVRRELLAALSTSSAHLDNPDATRAIAALLSEDPSVEVRLAAAEALGTRGDLVARGAVQRAATSDEDKGVRAAAAKAFLQLSSPRKAKPKPQPKPPKDGAVYGQDPCQYPWGWCSCKGIVTVRPRCLTKDECDNFRSEMRRHDLSCTWSGSGGGD